MSEEIALAAADRAEIVRLHAIVAQQQRALDAERRAREIAQADALAIQDAIWSIAWMAHEYAQAGGSSGPEMRDYQAFEKIMQSERRGAALLAELDALRTLKRAVVRYFNMRGMAHAAAAGNEDIAAMLDALAGLPSDQKERQP